MPKPHELLAEYLEAIGLTGDDMRDTPARLTALLTTFRPAELPPMTPIELEDSGPVAVLGIPFHSLCAHHLVPFFGHADVAYLPSGRVAGLGSIARLVQALARRPQLQERLTEQIAARLALALDPLGVAVRVRARQMCLELRGNTEGTRVQTEAYRGETAQLLRLLDR